MLFISGAIVIEEGGLVVTQSEMLWSFFFAGGQQPRSAHAALAGLSTGRKIQDSLKKQALVIDIDGEESIFLWCVKWKEL